VHAFVFEVGKINGEEATTPSKYDAYIECVDERNAAALLSSFNH
jgi:hypothetical protein